METNLLQAPAPFMTWLSSAVQVRWYAHVNYCMAGHATIEAAMQTAHPESTVDDGI